MIFVLLITLLVIRCGMTSGWGWPSRRRGRGERPSSVLTDTPGKNLKDANNIDTDLSPPRRGGDRQGSEYRWGQGQCFSLTNGLAWEETWDPCSGRPTARAHEEWGYCQVAQPPPPQPLPSPPPQAGTSAALLPDRTALIGTPGPHTWRGTVFAVSTSDVSIPPTFCPG